MPEMKNFFLILFISLFLFSSLKCNRSDEKINEDKLKEHLMNANRIMVKDEQQQIEEFIARHNWKMNATGTGLRYMIYENGTGKNTSANDSVTFTGKIFLLDATLCYEYKKESPLKFSIGQKDVPRGFEEAAMLLREGDKARLVIPAHLSYGLLADNKNIPRSTALFAELELAEVKSVKKKE